MACQWYQSYGVFNNSNGGKTALLGAPSVQLSGVLSLGKIDCCSNYVVGANLTLTFCG